jgi:hypothetical protein
MVKYIFLTVAFVDFQVVLMLIFKVQKMKWSQLVLESQNGDVEIINPLPRLSDLVSGS